MINKYLFMRAFLFVILIQLFLPLLAFTQESSAKQLLEAAKEQFAEDKDTTLDLLDKAMRRAKANNDTAVYYESNLQKAYVLKNIGSKSEAIKRTRTLLEKAREDGNTFYEAKCLKLLGEISRSKSALDNSLSYLFGALEIYQRLHHKRGIADTYNRLAATYFQLSEYKNSQQYADSSLSISKAIADSALLGNNYEILGAISRDKESGKALDYFQKAKEIYQKYAPNNVPNVSLNLLLYYSRKGETKRAIEIGEKALKRARKQNNKAYIENLAKQLADEYKILNDYKTALKYLQTYVDTKVEIYKQTKDDLAAFYRHRFEARKRQHQIEMQKHRIQKEKAQQKYYLVGIGALFVFLLGGAFAYIKIVRKNKMLKAQKEKIEEQQDEIIKQNEELQATNEKLVKVDQLKQDLTNMLVHDLKNPLNIVVNLAENRYVRSAGNVMNNLIMNMLDMNKFEEVELTPDEAVCNLKRLASGAEEQVHVLLEDKEMTLQNDIPDDIYVNVDEKLITRVIVNFLTNAIKHSEENKPVILSAGEPIQKQGGEFIEVSVTDYGPGISEEDKDKLFDRYSSGGHNSDKVTPTGLGLAFCKMVVEAHNGTVGVESEKEKYSRFYFTLPKAS